MVAVRMMQVAVYQVVNVIAVWNRRVTTVRTVNVVRVMSLTIMIDTPIGILCGDFDGMFIVVPVMRAVEMTVVQIADMPSVLYSNVATIRSVCMVMVFMNLVGHFRVPRSIHQSILWDPHGRARCEPGFLRERLPGGSAYPGLPDGA